MTSGGARAGLDEAIVPSETCLAPAQPLQRFPNDLPVFNSVSLSLTLKKINIKNLKKCLMSGIYKLFYGGGVKQLKQAMRTFCARR